MEGNTLEVRTKRKERSKGMIQRGPLSNALLYIVRNLDLHEHVHVLLINPGVNNKYDTPVSSSLLCVQLSFLSLRGEEEGEEEEEEGGVDFRDFCCLLVSYKINQASYHEILQ